MIVQDISPDYFERFLIDVHLFLLVAGCLFNQLLKDTEKITRQSYIGCYHTIVFFHLCKRPDANVMNNYFF